MDKGKRVARLRSLARLDVDAVAAYDAAIARVEVESAKTKLSEFRLDHVRHVQDLNALLAKLGSEQVLQAPDLKGALLKAMTAAGSALGTEAALISMMANEGLTNARYELSLRGDWDPDERVVVEKNREDERRHLAWIRDAVLQRRWAHEPAEAHP